jgi:hypothetical protein
LQVRILIPEDTQAHFLNRVKDLLEDSQDKLLVLRNINRYIGSWGHSFQRCDNAHKVYKHLDQQVKAVTLKYLSQTDKMSLRQAKRKYLQGHTVTLEQLSLRTLFSILQKADIAPISAQAALAGEAI